MQNCLLIGLTAGLQGWDHGAASGALHNLVDLKGLSGQEELGPLLQGWIISSAWASTIVGNLSGLYAPTPRLALALAAALEALGSLLTGLAPTLPLLIVGRLINGLGLGLTGVAVGQYTSEVAPPSVRGGAIACQETNFVAGALLGSLAGRHWLRRKGGWRQIWGLASIGGLLALVAALRMPDTPRSIFKRAVASARAARPAVDSPEAAQQRVLAGLEEARRDALRAMCEVRGLREADDALLEELEVIEQTYASELVLRGRAGPSSPQAVSSDSTDVELREEWWQEELPLSEIFGSEVRRRLLLTGMLANTFPALSGHEALLHYSTQTFNEVGFDIRDGASLAVGLYSMKMLTTIPDFLWLDMVGRRMLLAVGLGGVIASYKVALAGVLLGGHVLPGVALVGSALAYQIAVGPVTWIVSTEMYPSDMRTKGCALAAAVYAMTTLVSVQFHPLLLRRGPRTTLLTYVFTGAAALLLSRIFIPETKGRSLEEIQADAFSGELWRRGSINEARAVLGLLPSESPVPQRAG